MRNKGERSHRLPNKREKASLIPVLVKYYIGLVAFSGIVPKRDGLKTQSRPSSHINAV